jgi:pimeloyl-ACP methyl ester carboxylesterase
MATAPSQSGYAPVNGLQLYYEVHGTGQPLVLLHGGLGSTESVKHVATQLAARRRVIAVDLQAHGRTADVDRPITYEAMADDVAGVLGFLGIKRADAMGYSLGGGTALRLAIQHPNLVRKLIVVSTPYKRTGWYPDVLAGMDQLGAEAAEMMKPSPLYQTYARVAPRPEDWPVLVSKTGALLRRDYDWGNEVAAIQSPTLLVFGDADSIPPSHAAEFFGLLGGGKADPGWDGSDLGKARLAILPGVTHYNIFDSPALAPTVISFLDSLPLADR